IFGAVRVREVRAIAFDLREHAARTAMTVGRLRTAVSDLDRHQRTYVATADPQVGLLVDGTVRGIAAGVDSLVAFGYGDELRQGGFPLDALIAVRDSLHVLVEAGELNGA